MNKCSGITPYSDVSADLVKECSSKSTRKTLLIFNIVLIIFVVIFIIGSVIIRFSSYSEDKKLDKTDKQIEDSKKRRNSAIIFDIFIILIVAFSIGLPVNILVSTLNLKNKWETTQANIKECMSATNKGRKACAYDVEQRELMMRHRTPYY